MKLLLRLTGMLGFAATLGFATTWSGALVDGKCYAGFQGNTRNPMSYVDRDTAWEIGYCAPRFKTSSFELVPVNGSSFPLDSHGNAQASAIVRKVGRRRLIVVQVAGVKKGKDISVSRVKVMRVLRRPY